MTAKYYLQPLGLLAGGVCRQATDRGLALPLAGLDHLAFTHVRFYDRQDSRRVSDRLVPVSGFPGFLGTFPAETRARLQHLLNNLTRRRPPLVLGDGLSLDPRRPLIQGILNVTPDSFSDGGRFDDPEAALRHARGMIAAGADLIDIGGESTRPGAAPVLTGEEMGRVLPLVEALAGAGVPLSVDTRNAPVMRAALARGAHLINDVSALTHDPDSLAVMADSSAPVILMHARGAPQTMQQDPRYDNVLLDVFDYLEARLACCEAAGISRDRLIVDPGIGFGKTVEHNLALLQNISLLHGLGVPLLLGVSRKSFIAALDEAPDTGARLPGSLAAAQGFWAQGGQVVRVHDVAETRQALTIWSHTHIN